MTKEEIRAFEDLMRNSVNVLKGSDDPRIWQIIAYMRQHLARARKANRSETADESLLSGAVAPAPLRGTYRRY
jgi:hypothetical protein